MTADAAPPSASIDRWFWIALVISLAVVLPRSLLIARAHSESYDDQYHIVRGLVQLTGEDFHAAYNDPPLGELIMALPVWIGGCRLENAAKDPLVIATKTDPREAIYSGQPMSTETIHLILAAWKSILFLPCAAIVFHWSRKLYGLPSAWLALAVVLVDPNIAAHIPIPALDLLGAEAILIACYFSWEYFQSPTMPRLVGMTFAVAVALLIKHTANIVPLVVIAFAILHLRRCPLPWKIRLRNAAIGIAIFLLMIWALTLFDISRPRDYAFSYQATYNPRWKFIADTIDSALSQRWPAGIYISSFVSAYQHNAFGHWNYLLGEMSMQGWWYYHFVAAGLKIPIPIIAILVLGFVSLFWRRWNRNEMALLIPMELYALLLIGSSINIGFRHDLPIYLLAIVFASRAMTGRMSNGIGWSCVVLAGINSFAWHPDYLGFINMPIDRPEKIISDSNLDWGQSLKQIREWLDRHPQFEGKVTIGYFGNQPQLAVPRYLDDRVKVWKFVDKDPLPMSGILIISSVLEGGAWTTPEQVKPLENRRYVDEIGHCMRVYDMDGSP